MEKPLLKESEQSKHYTRLPHFSAIVDVERNHTFAVVASGYHLVPNKEAIELGKQCFRQVFSQASADDMELFNIISPKTRSYCHIDFLHRAHEVPVLGGDTWWPYLRLTNSYNRIRSLRFDLGFCRAICTNGMILGDKKIRSLRFPHTRERIGKADFTVEIGELKEFEDSFVKRMKKLKNCQVPQKKMLALVCKALAIAISPADVADAKKRERLLDFRNKVHKLTNQYVSDLGPNAYAALNVITDFASRPEAYFIQTTMIDSLQRRAGDWVSEFVETISAPRFDFAQYLGSGKQQDAIEMLLAI